MVERWMADRLLRHLEPHIQNQMTRFLASDEGRDLVAELFTDLVTDLVTPSSGEDMDLLEVLVLKLANRLAAQRPTFRQHLHAQLSGIRGPEPQ
jgi:hypothetical protein